MSSSWRTSGASVSRRDLPRALDLYLGELERQLTPRPSCPSRESRSSSRAWQRSLASRSAFSPGNLERGARLKLAPPDYNRYFPFGAFGSDSADRYELPPIAVERASAHTGRRFEGKSIVIVGDSVHDVACGRPLGVRAVPVATGPTRRSDWRRNSPDALFESFADVEARSKRSSDEETPPRSLSPPRGAPRRRRRRAGRPRRPGGARAPPMTARRSATTRSRLRSIRGRPGDPGALFRDGLRSGGGEGARDAPGREGRHPGLESPAEIFERDLAAAFDEQARISVFDFRKIREERDQWEELLAMIARARGRADEARFRPRPRAASAGPDGFGDGADRPDLRAFRAGRTTSRSPTAGVGVVRR